MTALIALSRDGPSVGIVTARVRNSKKTQAAPFTSHRLTSVSATQFPPDARYASARMMARSRLELFEGPATALAESAASSRCQTAPSSSQRLAPRPEHPKMFSKYLDASIRTAHLLPRVGMTWGQ